jgi:RNA polymerase sigma factor (sigma-70 family)
MNPTGAEDNAAASRRAQFETVVAEYEAALLRYASRIVLDSDAAQDVVQNTFISMLHNWRGEGSPGHDLSSWLYRVAHNCAVDHLRRESRRRRLHLRHAEEQPDAVPPDRGHAFQVSDEAAAAGRALHGLSLREQQLVILKVYEEKSYKEISAITGLTVTNVGYILHHAMRKMAQELRKVGEP